VAFALCVLPGGARAQSSENDPVYEEVMALRRRRGRRAAPQTIARMSERYRETHEARALATMGLAEVDIGRCNDAEQHLSEALSMPSAWIDQHRAGIEREFGLCQERLGVGALVVRSGATGAAVFVNGAQLGAAGRYLRVQPGPMTYELRAPGFVRAQRTVTVRRGATTSEAVELTLEPTLAPPVVEALPAPSTPAAVTPPAPPTRELLVVVAGRAIPAKPPGGVTDVPAAGGSVGRTLAWVSGAGALVLLGVGAVGYVIGDDAAARWNDNSLCLRPGVGTRESMCSSERDTAESMRVVTIAGFAGAGVLAATSAVLFALSPRRAPPWPAVRDRARSVSPAR
jgi:hypothetical protein